MLFNEVEAASSAQASAADSAAGAEVAGNAPITDPVARRKPGGRRSLSPALPRVTVTRDLPEAERVCPKDGNALHRIGEVVSEQLDIVPMLIRVLRHVRPSYGCRCCGETVKTATLPAQPIPQSIASSGTLAHLAVSKYAEHLPLYRQEQILKRHGLDISRATLAQWMLNLGELETPLLNLLQDHLLESPVIQMDETPVQVLKEDWTIGRGVSDIVLGAGVRDEMPEAVVAWLAALPVRASGRKQPRVPASKIPELTGALAGWEKYLGR